MTLDGFEAVGSVCCGVDAFHPCWNRSFVISVAT